MPCDRGWTIQAHRGAESFEEAAAPGLTSRYAPRAVAGGGAQRGLRCCASVNGRTR